VAIVRWYKESHNSWCFFAAHDAHTSNAPKEEISSMVPHRFLLAAAALLATPALAAPAPQSATVTPQFAHEIPNIPGKSLKSVLVTYAPGGISPAHHHASSAFIYAYVLEGEIRSQVNDEPVRIYHAGEGWYETPGAHHKVSENASKTKPAKLLAVFVVDSSDKALTTPDAH
jgi:quercetin dioxygenase-like cupin family protein